MKKGDTRRELILDAARELFYERGYEKTSVQDILDALKLSKGGFYHHFESKLQLLEELCVAQLRDNATAMQEAVARNEGNAVAQLNELLARCAPWQPGQEAFYRLMLRVAWQGGSVQLRDAVRRTMIDSARPLMRQIIHLGVAQKQFFTRYPDEIGELLLLLFANVSDEIAALMMGNSSGDNVMSAILNLLAAYRSAVETLIGAPYGSIVLYDLEQFPNIMAQMAQ